MVERGRLARLGLEPPPESRVGGELGGDHLERHRPSERDVGGPVDHAHAAAADEFVDAVPGELHPLFDVDVIF